MSKLSDHSKEDLLVLRECVELNMTLTMGSHEFVILHSWLESIKEAISDREFEDNQLPFKKSDDK